MSHSVELSIITTVYHDLEGLIRTCRSLEFLHGKGISWEQVVVDSSPSESQDWIQSLKDKSWPVLHVECPPQGVYPAMNLGIQRSSGRYIWFLNSGDELSDVDSLLSALKNLRDQQGVLLWSDVYFGSRDSRKIKKTNHTHLVQNLLGENKVCHQGCLFAAELFSKKGLYDTRYRLAADYAFLWSCTQETEARLIGHRGPPFATFYSGGRSGQFGKVLSEFRQIHNELNVTLGLRCLNWVRRGWARIRIQGVVLRDLLKNRA